MLRTHFRFKATLDDVEEVQVSINISDTIGKLGRIFSIIPFYDSERTILLANPSAAFGTVNIKGKLNHVKQVVALLDKYACHWDYNICLNQSTFQQSAVDSKRLVEYTMDFTSIGRWSFSNNINYLFRWLNEDVEEENNPIELSDWHQLLLEKDYSLSMTFDFIDEESGCDVLSHETIRIQVNSKMKNWDKSVGFENNTNFLVEELFFESFDVTAENLLDLNVYELGEVFDNTERGIKSGLYALNNRYHDNWHIQWSERLANLVNISKEQLLDYFSLDYLSKYAVRDDQLFYDIESWLFENEWWHTVVRTK